MEQGALAMADDGVVVDVQDQVLVLTLNRPDKLNAVNFAMVGVLLEQVHRASEDPDIRCVLLRGAGRAFCAGDDVVAMGDLPRSMSPGEHPVQAMQQTFIKRWYWLRKPTVAAIRGRCHGFGHDMALAADFRVVSSTAVMGDIRGRRAVPVGSGGTFLLPQLIGLSAATQLMLTGDTIGVADIERLGLAAKVFDDDKFDEAAMEFAANLAQGPTKAMGIAKYEMHRNLGGTLEGALDVELSLLGEPVEDRVEGVKSFMEGRAPTYTGR
jgi:2-(1,2-epoxy-1,2-dihydrophenyl)acetyl-CoA isomerase